ncbi:winged helix-turn-helix transcriptional regulator [Streptomyces sp. S6]|nr:winged helix-turn-helix transcriptional regulator [Streptomyces sp. S6]
MSTNQPDSPVEWLSAAEESTWRAYLRMVTAVQVRTARDLAGLGLSEPDYEVLSTLSERPDGTSTLHEQADKMGWSRSRLSRHASRMEARDLVRRPWCRRRPCCLLVLITGWDTLRDAAPSHVASVRRHVVDRLDPEELAALGAIARKLAADGPAPGA